MASIIITGAAGSETAATALPIWAQWLQLPVAAALVTGVIGLMIVGLNRWVQADRIKADKEIATDRFALDKELAEKKLAADLRLAERKLELDQKLEDWRRRSAFAEELLSEFYRARTVVSAIRSPAIWGHEYENRVGRDQEPEPLRQRRDQYLPYIDRIRANGEFLDGLHARRFRAIAIFGAGAELPFERIRQVIVRVQAAAHSLLNYQSPEAAPQMAQHNENMLKVIWEGYGADGETPDQFQQTVDQVVDLAEQLFRPALVALPNALAPQLHGGGAT